MKYRKCPVCKKEIDYDSTICKHCKKGVFVFDFGEESNSSFNWDRFRPAYGEICGWHDIVVPEGAPKPKPPTEWRCVRREPEVFIDE